MINNPSHKINVWPTQTQTQPYAAKICFPSNSMCLKKMQSLLLQNSAYDDLTKSKLTKKKMQTWFRNMDPKIKLFPRYRPKRHAQDSNSTIPFAIPSFVTEYVQCNTVIRRVCPGAGIGCTVCQYYSKGTCTAVCTVKDIICNAALMRCLDEKS